jgi:NADPH2:quinone reductase
MVQMMRAVQCLGFGEPAMLSIAKIPRPALTAGHARVRVEYCGVGLPEALILAGKYQVKPPVPFVPGSEIAGVVTEIASDVRHVCVGARIAGINHSFTGGLAEESVSPVTTMVELPPGISTRLAAGMLVNYATAYHALVQRAALCPGETVLVLGAAGGVGVACIEIGRALRANVLAGCGSRAKLEVARCHGATAAFDYDQTSVRDAVMQFTAGRGVDVVVDPVGGSISEQALRCLRPRGRLLVVGFASGEIPRVPLNLPLLKSCSIVGVSLGTLALHEPAGLAANLAAVFQLYEQGKLQPELVDVDCFDNYAAGLALIGKRDRVGKIVMRICNGTAG